MSKRKTPFESIFGSAAKLHPRSRGPSPQPAAEPTGPTPTSSTSSPLPPPKEIDPSALHTNLPMSLNASSGAASTKHPAENEAWAGLEVALNGLEKCCSVFPPLESAVSALLNSVKEIPGVYKRRQEYIDLASDLEITVDSLAEHVQNSGSTRMSNCVSNLVNTIQQEIKNINEQQQRHLLSRIAKSVQEENNLVRCYRRIESCFRQLQVNACLSIWSVINEQVANSRLDRLPTAKQAPYDSAESGEIGRRECNPNTRAKILSSLHGWVNSPSSPKLYWMNGMAGTGKTTIAYSLSKLLEQAYQLGASFFCTRLLPDCRNVTRIVPTIAYQLARFSLPFQSALCEMLGRTPDIGNYNIDKQFEMLLREPLLAAKEAMPRNVVIVIDALDECSESSGTRNILDILFRYTAELPVKFFVASRPEPIIRDKMLSQGNRSRTVFILHDIKKSVVQADIQTYLHRELALVSPSIDQVQRLAEQGGNLFIYAATAVRYIAPEDPVVDSNERLATILEMAPMSHEDLYNEIDALYTTILEIAFDSRRLNSIERERMRLVLHTVICAREPMSMKALGGLLGMDDERKILLAVKPLRSVLYVSEDSGVLSTFHASFPDYMLSEPRSRRFLCNQSQENQRIVMCCFNIMKDSLRFNICNLKTSYIPDSDVPNLTARIDEAITPQLFYACRFWGDHLKDVEVSGELCALLQEFLFIRLLFWMEVLSLKRSLGLGDRLLHQSHDWLEIQGVGLDLRPFVQDARRLLSYVSIGPISSGTPYIYVSVLSSCVKHSLVSRHYSEHMGCPQIFPPSQYAGSIKIITSVALSSDGTHVVSASNGCRTHIWENQEDAIIVGPFSGSANPVSSLAFSHDGTRVAIGFRDGTIHIRDTPTGAVINRPLEGRSNSVASNSVASVAFSRDDTCVVSVHSDLTVCTWYINTGAIRDRRITGYINPATLLAFSQNGTRIAVGSDGHRITIWDIEKEAVVSGPLIGHTSRVSCIAFSSDGTRVVSGSHDFTIRIWDTDTGAIVFGPLKGHTDWVTCVAFSADGIRVASGSQDGTIRVRNIHSSPDVSWKIDTSGCSRDM